MTKNIWRSKTIQVLLLIGGLLFIALGLNINSSTWSNISNAFGGALFGAALSNFFASLLEGDLAENMARTLADSLSPGFGSEEKQISSFRNRWYYYYVTQMNNEYFWRMITFDFDNKVVGKLLSRMALRNKSNEMEYYKVEGGIREGAFVIIFDPEVRTIEPVMVSLLPIKGVTGPYYGILYLMTWDHTYAMSPCMISRKPILDWSTEQDAMPGNVASQFDELWKSEFTKSNKILPRINLEQITRRKH
jgi:hypothetical protein